MYQNVQESQGAADGTSIFPHRGSAVGNPNLKFFIGIFLVFGLGGLYPGMDILMNVLEGVHFGLTGMHRAGQ